MSIVVRFHPTNATKEKYSTFVEEVRRDDPELANYLRIEEREAGGLD